MTSENDVVLHVLYWDTWWCRYKLLYKDLYFRLPDQDFQAVWINRLLPAYRSGRSAARWANRLDSHKIAWCKRFSDDAGRISGRAWFTVSYHSCRGDCAKCSCLFRCSHKQRRLGYPQYRCIVLHRRFVHSVWKKLRWPDRCLILDTRSMEILELRIWQLKALSHQFYFRVRHFQYPLERGVLVSESIWWLFMIRSQQWDSGYHTKMLLMRCALSLPCNFLMNPKSTPWLFQFLALVLQYEAPDLIFTRVGRKRTTLIWPL